MAEFKYEITKHVATLSENKGYTKEINYISYNGRPETLDIRNWYTDEEGNKTMQKGITLNEKEVEKLIEVLSNLK